MNPFTSISNPQWNNAQNTAILLTVTLANYPNPMKFLAAPWDTEPYGVELYNQAVAGDFGPIAPYVPPAPQTPPQG